MHRLVDVTLPADPSSVTAARRLVTEALGVEQLPNLIDDAALCVSELTSNAVLHARRPFHLTVLRSSVFVRIEVTDPITQLPIPVPMTGTATGLSGGAMTGRGLQLVARSSDRWGATATTSGKCTWCELRLDRAGLQDVPVPALFEDERQEGDEANSGGDTVTLHFVGLPVRTAVASGLQVDDLVRQLQVDTGTAASKADLDHLYDLLDRSAPARLGGRRAALEAAGADRRRFDLTLGIPLDALTATYELNVVLDSARERFGLHSEVSEPVRAFRQWLVEETGRQLEGRPATRCPLPD